MPPEMTTKTLPAIEWGRWRMIDGVRKIGGFVYCFVRFKDKSSKYIPYAVSAVVSTEAWNILNGNEAAQFDLLNRKCDEAQEIFEKVMIESKRRRMLRLLSPTGRPYMERVKMLKWLSCREYREIEKAEAEKSKEKKEKAGIENG